MGCCGPKSPTEQKEPQEAAKGDHAACDTHHHHHGHEQAVAKPEAGRAPDSTGRSNAK